MAFSTIFHTGLVIAITCGFGFEHKNDSPSYNKELKTDTVYFMIENKVELKGRWVNPTGVESVEAVVAVEKNELIVRPRKLGEFSVTFIYKKRTEKRKFFSVYIPKPTNSTTKVLSSEDDRLLIKHLLKNIRYPQAAVKINQEKTLYLSLEFNKAGKIEKYKIKENEIDETYNELVIVGEYNPSTPIKFNDGSNQYTKLFASSLRSVLEKTKFPPNQISTGKQYHFKISYRIEKIFDQLSEPY